MTRQPALNIDENDSHAPADAKQTRSVKKLNNEIPLDDYKVLESWAEEENVTITSCIRQAIRHSEFIREIMKSKKKLLVEDENGKIRQIEFR